MTINDMLKSNDLEDGEKLFLQYRYGMTDQFTTHLFNCIVHATGSDIKRLSGAYPDRVKAYLKWKNGELKKKIKNIGFCL